VEAASDPFLCPFVGSTGPVYLQGNLYSPDPFEVYLPGMFLFCLNTVLFPGKTS
jgi:hypothetical protein